MLLPATWPPCRHYHLMLPSIRSVQAMGSDCRRLLSRSQVNENVGPYTNTRTSPPNFGYEEQQQTILQSELLHCRGPYNAFRYPSK
jgi:hypothetical protein